MAPSTNLFIEQGSDFTRTITLEQKIGATIVPLDLTGFTAEAKLKKSYYSQTSVDFVVNIVDAINGKLTISLTNAETSALKPGRYVYDIVIVSAGLLRDRVLEGTVIVTPGVTLP
jgi:hypothetical protein